jgi:hypothetical protein
MHTLFDASTVREIWLFDLVALNNNLRKDK